VDAARHLHVRRDVPIIEPFVAGQSADCLLSEEDLPTAVHDRLPRECKQSLVPLGRNIYGGGQDAARIPWWIAQPRVQIERIGERDKRAGAVPVAERGVVAPPRRQPGRVAAQTQQRARCPLDLVGNMVREAHGAVEEQVQGQRGAACGGHFPHAALEHVARVPPSRRALMVVAVHLRPDGLQAA
jgi:hypothetical protein